MPKDLTFIAKTNFRRAEQVFGIKRADRRQHMYIIGKTGAGKTAFLKNMALQDINNGEGLAIIDPHGEFVEEVLDNIPPHRMNDVVYFNPADMEFPVSFNIMDVSDPKYKHLIASGLIGIFTKIWANVWSARMEYILANCILALLDTPGTTLLGIPRMLVDRDYRQKIINNLKDPVVKSFWVNEYEEWDNKYRNEAIAPVQNKVGQFLNVSFVRNIVGQSKNTVDVDEIMNNQKILLVNVSKGRIGEDNSAILGAMLITKIQLSAMERVRIPEDERKDFYMYVDEFQNFATDSFVNILSEARKYRLDLIIAHQYIGQLTTDTSTAVRDAVFGNVGTMISFRVGAADAEVLELEFTPEFLQNDLIRLPNYNIYLKLMIDGISSRPFSARTIAPAPTVKDDKKRTEIIKISRSKYAHTVKEVEDEINRWAGSIDVPNVNNSPSDFSNPQADFSNPQGPAKTFYKPNNPVSSKTSDGTKLYDVKCSNCGKDTKVIFEPAPGRPVYCKNCLKKLKAGEINPVAPIASFSSPGINRITETERPDKSLATARQFDGPAPISPKASLGGDSALGDLGIEFAPSPSFSKPDKSPERHFEGPATISPKESLGGIEPISFHSRRNNEKPASQLNGRAGFSEAKQVKRKEINLSELRKALEESLANKPQNSKAAPEGGEPRPEKDSGREELENRVEEEKYEDKAIAQENPGIAISAPSPAKPEEPVSVKTDNMAELKNKKEIIKPGETVKL